MKETKTCIECNEQIIDNDCIEIFEGYPSHKECDDKLLEKIESNIKTLKTMSVIDNE